MDALTKMMWDTLRDVATSTKQKAHCVVMLNEKDFSEFVKRLDKDKIVAWAKLQEKQSPI